MVSTTIDHMVALIIFIAAITLFIGLFNQTIQTAVVYQNHSVIANEASDLIDTILLSPGAPTDWGTTANTPSSFGIQDPEFSQYAVSPFSLAHLYSYYGTPIYYGEVNTTSGMYDNLTMNSGGYFLMPYESLVTYSSAEESLGISNSYGFQLTLTPIVTIAINQIQTNPLTFSVQVEGISSTIANATVNYTLLTVSLNNTSKIPRYTTESNSTVTDSTGSAIITFPDITNSNISYVFLAYASLSGLNGVGYYVNSINSAQSVIPIVGNIGNGTIILANNLDVSTYGGSTVENDAVSYNTTLFVLTEDHNFNQLILNDSGIVGNGYSQYGQTTIPSFDQAILVTVYNSSATDTGISIMPWGLGSLGCTLTFGGNPSNAEWVSTDIRQVLVGGIAYQAKLAVWSYTGTTVIG